MASFAERGLKLVAMEPEDHEALSRLARAFACSRIAQVGDLVRRLERDLLAGMKPAQQRAYFGGLMFVYHPQDKPKAFRYRKRRDDDPKPPSDDDGEQKAALREVEVA